MTIALTKLPYESDALEPHISAQTMEFHHGKHHKAYVDKLNAAIKGSDYANMQLNEIVIHSHKSGETGIFNNAAQTWNHGFYWHCLTENTLTELSGDLQSAVDKDFGSTSEMLAQLQTAGEKHFGSGWAWLVANGGKLKITSMHDADTPIAMADDMIPLLTLDIWEHAYYLDRQNEKPKYLEAAIQNLINWKFVSDNYASDTAWQYPFE